ncbi:MAG: carboxypeptidase regulatory-like domain-containing protein [Acidobacteriota bacterium]
MFKRSLLLLLLVPALTLSSAGCGGKDEDAEADEDTTPTAKSAAAAPASAGAPAAAPAAGGATISGKVTFAGPSPAKETIKMEADAFCKSAHTTPVYTEEAVVNGNGTLDWVLVYVKDVQGKFPAPTTAVTLDQRGCQYHPHVFGIQAGQELKIINSDGTLHNIHALPKVNAEFNIGQPFPKMETVKKFDKPEVPVRFKCDVHKWMGAYAGVFSHPFFATTNDQGTFEIKNLPAGTYTVEAWHEKYGTQTSSVTVGGSETKTVDFGFKG